MTNQIELGSDFRCFFSSYASPLAVSFGDEIDEAIRICFCIIDRPPAEYRMVKQAIQGLIHLSLSRAPLRPIVMLKLLHIIRNPKLYRSNPRRFAVRGIGHLASKDDSVTHPSIDLLFKMIEKRHEPSQYVRKAAFCALSRIGRKFPRYQDKFVPVFLSHYQDPAVRMEVKWGILIGLGRMAQTSSLLRKTSYSLWLQSCCSPHYRMRWAAIKGLCQACCVSGNVKRDVAFEEKCFEIAMDLLVYKETDVIAKSDYYLVQYGTMQGIGLLLRVAPEHWWPRLAPVFAEILSNPDVASMVKASAMLSLGKVAFYMSETNPYFERVKDILMELSNFENILVSEPACYSLANMALGHPSMYNDIKELLQRSSKLGNSLSSASDEQLLYYLKTWCKFISNQYIPVLKDCYSVSCTYVESSMSQQELDSFDKHFRTPPPPSSSSSHMARKKKSENEHVEGAGVTEAIANRAKLLAPDFMDHIKPRHFLVDKNEPEVEEEVVVEAQEDLCETVSQIVQSSSALYELCSTFSPSVLSSIVSFLKDPKLLEDQTFLEKLETSITEVKSHTTPPSPPYTKLAGWRAHFDYLSLLSVIQKENAVAALLYPDSLRNSLWASNVQQIAVLHLSVLSGDHSDPTSDADIPSPPPIYDDTDTDVEMEQEEEREQEVNTNEQSPPSPSSPFPSPSPSPPPSPPLHSPLPLLLSPSLSPIHSPPLLDTLPLLDQSGLVSPHPFPSPPPLQEQEEKSNNKIENTRSPSTPVPTDTTLSLDAALPDPMKFDPESLDLILPSPTPFVLEGEGREESEEKEKKKEDVDQSCVVSPPSLSPVLEPLEAVSTPSLSPILDPSEVVSPPPLSPVEETSKNENTEEDGGAPPVGKKRKRKRRQRRRKRRNVSNEGENESNTAPSNALDNMVADGSPVAKKQKVSRHPITTTNDTNNNGNNNNNNSSNGVQGDPNSPCKFLVGKCDKGSNCEFFHDKSFLGRSASRLPSPSKGDWHSHRPTPTHDRPHPSHDRPHPNHDRLHPSHNRSHSNRDRLHPSSSGLPPPRRGLTVGEMSRSTILPYSTGNRMPPRYSNSVDYYPTDLPYPSRPPLPLVPQYHPIERPIHQEPMQTFNRDPRMRREGERLNYPAHPAGPPMFNVSASAIPYQPPMSHMRPQPPHFYSQSTVVPPPHQGRISREGRGMERSSMAPPRNLNYSLSRNNAPPRNHNYSLQNETPEPNYPDPQESRETNIPTREPLPPNREPPQASRPNQGEDSGYYLWSRQTL